MYMSSLNHMAAPSSNQGYSHDSMIIKLFVSYRDVRALLTVFMLLFS